MDGDGGIFERHARLINICMQRTQWGMQQVDPLLKHFPGSSAAGLSQFQPVGGGKKQVLRCQGGQNWQGNVSRDMNIA